MSKHRVHFDPKCDFCLIARGEQSEENLLWRDQAVAVFSPLEPATEGHCLVVPVSHVEDALDLDKDTAIPLWLAVTKLGRIVKTALNAEGINIITSIGKVATQSVFHTHVHVVPRYSSDNMGEIWPTEGVSSSAAHRAADRIREALNDRRPSALKLE
jgi:histidine triad (HIT) family protein